MNDVLRCSFCGHTLEEVRRLAGTGGDPGVYICNDCATLFDQQMKEGKEAVGGKAETEDDFRCSFCGTQRRKPYRLAAREQESGVCICDKCVEVRRCMLEDEESGNPT